MTTLATASYRDTDYPEPCFIENIGGLPEQLLADIVADPFLPNKSSIEKQLNDAGWSGTIESHCCEQETFNGKFYFTYEFYIRP